MARNSSVRPPAADCVVDFFNYAPRRAPSRKPRRRRESDWRPVVTDDFPDPLPITDAELDIIEAHFADLLDELFGPRG